MAPAIVGPQPVRATGPIEVTFTNPGGNGWTVPPDVTQIDVVLVGGKGGKGGYTDSPGGFGARVQGTLSVTPGMAFNIRVGGNGTDGSPNGPPGAGGFNGGGGGGSNGDVGGGGGGGASDLKSSDGTILLVAAGGGGGGGHDTNATGDFAGGIGGNARQAGGTSSGNGPNGGGGLAGGPAAGGAGGTASGGGAVGQNGTAGFGGTGGAAGTTRAGAGGGGGGGHYGGGGGGGGGETSFITGAGGGGGGGWSYTGSGSAFESPDTTGIPMLKISYKTPQSITFPTIADTPIGTADFAPGATASSGLPVTYSASGACSMVAGPKIHVSTVGQCTVKAIQYGDATYGQSVLVTRIFNVIKKPQTTSFAAPANKAYGSADFALGATTSSGLAVAYAASGTCSIAGANIHINAAGSCTVTASQAGDATYAAAPDVSNTFTVAPAGTSVSALTVTTTSGNTTPQFSDTVSLKATVTAGSTATGTGVFTGKLLFRVNSKPTAGVSVAVGNTSATGTVALKLDDTIVPTGAGSYPVTVDFVPDPGSNYASSKSSAQTIAVKAEGLASTGATNGSTRLEYAGNSSVAVGAAPSLIANLRQGLSPEGTDKQFVDYSKIKASAVFKVYDAKCTTSCQPVWSSLAAPIANAADWATTGTGNAKTTGPTTLAKGSYRVEVSVATAGHVGAPIATAALTVGSTSGGFLGDAAGSDSIRLMLAGLFALVGVAIVAFYLIRRRTRLT